VIVDVVAWLTSHALAENNAHKYKSLLAHRIFSLENSATLFHFTYAAVKCRVSVK